MFFILGEMHRQILFINSFTGPQTEHDELIEKVVGRKYFMLGVMSIFGDLSLIISKFSLIPTATSVII